MAPYPTYKQVQTNIPRFDNVSEFFNRASPNGWTLEGFALDPDSNDFHEFESGLEIIKNQGRDCYNTHASNCLKWYKSADDDDPILTNAEGLLKLKLAKRNSDRVSNQIRERQGHIDLEKIQDAMGFQRRANPTTKMGLETNVDAPEESRGSSSSVFAPTVVPTVAVSDASPIPRPSKHSRNDFDTTSSLPKDIKKKKKGKTYETEQPWEALMGCLIRIVSNA
ncbi:hypothetical protein BGZ80_006384 [Entomortierella chlamydospora]|uniref:Uncharacterized protein n=1 Tax=Entomortierella chlamydospora TaxID=101097 RepID=A0A9P6T204_9FUNG|nr:hypothetical protein BGZ80_006384 [Entomortierella chlamydospora]